MMIKLNEKIHTKQPHCSQCSNVHIFLSPLSRTCDSETEQDPLGLLGMEAFLCPPFLVCREQTPASMTFPEFQRAGSNSC